MATGNGTIDLKFNLSFCRVIYHTEKSSQVAMIFEAGFLRPPFVGQESSSL
jgi:hypothetical protein